jgi:hypothetical protein
MAVRGRLGSGPWRRAGRGRRSDSARAAAELDGPMRDAARMVPATHDGRHLRRRADHH